MCVYMYYVIIYDGNTTIINAVKHAWVGML